mmetsp:Transcript_21800/g.74951  ORF Transcript_21800/g.74951 Transcript_21800/m.74951 type:complete len:321 (-) Transcript_21800:7-969(-)
MHQNRVVVDGQVCDGRGLADGLYVLPAAGDEEAVRHCPHTTPGRARDRATCETPSHLAAVHADRPEGGPAKLAGAAVHDWSHTIPRVLTVADGHSDVHRRALGEAELASIGVGGAWRARQDVVVASAQGDRVEGRHEALVGVDPGEDAGDRCEETHPNRHKHISRSDVRLQVAVRHADWQSDQQRCDRQHRGKHGDVPEDGTCRAGAYEDNQRRNDQRHSNVLQRRPPYGLRHHRRRRLRGTPRYRRRRLRLWVSHGAPRPWPPEGIAGAMQERGAGALVGTVRPAHGCVSGALRPSDWASPPWSSCNPGGKDSSVILDP